MKKDKPRIEVGLPVLLRHARRTYGMAIHNALAEADAAYDDIPKNGLYVIGGLAIKEIDIPLGQLIRELGVSKQVAGQLVDTLVLRGYLDRKVDAEDRRKLTVTLTERGRAVAEMMKDVIEGIDKELLKRVSAEDVCRTRKTLAALIDMGFPCED